MLYGIKKMPYSSFSKGLWGVWGEMTDVQESLSSEGCEDGYTSQREGPS